MKTRIAIQVGCKASISFKSEKRIVLPTIYEINITMDEVREKIDFDSLTDEFGELLGWGLSPIYDTPSGELEPGCYYWMDWFPLDHYSSNQDGPMLCVVLPNGNHWNIDSRASNCTKPNDRTHRCWCRHGELPNITVDKNGETCSAGAGSILSGDYHGFLRNGEFIKS